MTNDKTPTRYWIERGDATLLSVECGSLTAARKFVRQYAKNTGKRVGKDFFILKVNRVR